MEEFVDGALLRENRSGMTALTERLNRFENRLHDMEAELAELRRLMTEPEPAPESEPEPDPEPEFVWSAPRPAHPRRELDLSALLGARALAWTGGAVMLLGIVFFFVLAVERGWIGPATRVTLGATASLLCLVAGAWLRRRFGDTYASLSAAGVGVGGLYATLLAATALYDLVPRPLALGLAAAIAASGAALALAWGSQTLASLGLLGALLVPLPIAIQDRHLSPVGTAFAVVVLAATIAVTVPRRWHALLAIATAIGLAETFALVAVHERGATAVAVAAWLVSAGGALWLALRTRLTYLPASLLALSAAFAGWSAGILYGGSTQGYALLVVGAAYVGASLALWRRDRDSAAMLWAIALTLGAVGAASLVSGVTLTIVWAAESALLARLARRIDEPRFQLASAAWLTLAYAHGLSVDAPFSKLFAENTDTWHAALSVASLALASAVVALSTFEWSVRDEGILARVLADLRAAQDGVRTSLVALAGAAALYAGSLFVVTLPSSWDWGHVAVAALWSGAGCALVLTRVRMAAFAVVAAAVVLLVYDLLEIDEPQRWWAFAAVAAGAVFVALVHELRSKAPRELPSLVGLAVGAALSTTAVAQLLDGQTRGYGLLALAVGYGALGVALLGRRRDFASALGLVALALAVPASQILLHGTWLVLAWAATCAALALLARFEQRLAYAAVGYLVLAAAHALVLEAPPSDLFVARAHPGGGAPAVLLVAAAALVAGRRLWRDALAWACGALLLYGTSLAILEVFEDTGSGVHSSFQHGHTAVSALWGIVGLALLVAGLKRAGRHLRLGGFALFGLALAKLFVYDLAALSSIARALSFLAVGALLIVGGFFYQRLATDVHSPA